MISLRACLIDCLEISISGMMTGGFCFVSAFDLDPKAASILSNLASISLNFSLKAYTHILVDIGSG